MSPTEDPSFLVQWLNLPYELPFSLSRFQNIREKVGLSSINQSGNRGWLNKARSEKQASIFYFDASQPSEKLEFRRFPLVRIAGVGIESGSWRSPLLSLKTPRGVTQLERSEELDRAGGYRLDRIVMIPLVEVTYRAEVRYSPHCIGLNMLLLLYLVYKGK